MSFQGYWQLSLASSESAEDWRILYREKDKEPHDDISGQHLYTVYVQMPK